MLSVSGWMMVVFLLTLAITFLMDCYVLEVSTELVDDGRKERTSKVLLFRKGVVEFVVGSYHKARPVEGARGGEGREDVDERCRSHLTARELQSPLKRGE